MHAYLSVPLTIVTLLLSYCILKYVLTTRSVKPAFVTKIPHVTPTYQQNASVLYQQNASELYQQNAYELYQQNASVLYQQTAPELYQQNAVNVAVLFTMYNTKKRQKMTTDTLNYYTPNGSDSNIAAIPKSVIYIVDSSNNGVSDVLVDKKNQVVFDQRLHCDTTGPVTGPTYAELCALKFTIKQINFAERQHTHVIKFTTKYKIPEFNTSLLGQIDPCAELILQHTRKERHSFLFKKTGWQNTEILGFKVSRIHEILTDLENLSGDLETRVFKLAASGKYIVQRLPLLSVEQPFYSRSDGSILSALKSKVKPKQEIVEKQPSEFEIPKKN